MIKASDVAFHTPVPTPYDWAETNYFSYYIPEANITASVYVIARPGVGACVVDVMAIDKIGRLGLEALYIDFQQHLPMPEKLENFSLPNGLSLSTSNAPRDYRLDYVGVNGTEMHLDIKGLHEPYDIHDPEMDPRAPRDRNRAFFHSLASADMWTSMSTPNARPTSPMLNPRLPVLATITRCFARTSRVAGTRRAE